MTKQMGQKNVQDVTDTQTVIPPKRASLGVVTKAELVMLTVGVTALLLLGHVIITGI